MLENTSKWSKKASIEYLENYYHKTSDLYLSQLEETNLRVFENFSFNIQKCFLELNKYLNDVDHVGERIYGSHIIFFLDSLLYADRHVCVRNNTDLFESIFHPLVDSVLWKDWTLSYCKLVLNLESRKYTMGKYSTSILDHYKYYRKITLLNKIGFEMEESHARQEYDDLFEIARKQSSLYRVDPSNLFLNFVFTTLKCIAINRFSLDALVDFVHYFTRLKKTQFIIEWAIRYLLNIKLQDIYYKLSYIYDDSSKGQKIRTTLIYIQNLPWMKVNSDIFTKFLRISFPDLKSVIMNELITSLNSITDCEVDDPKPFLKWFNLIPFMNGLFDFTFSNSENIYQNTFKHNSLNHIEFEFNSKNNTEEFSVETLCKNSRRGIFSKEYYDNLVNLNLNKNLKNYRNGVLFKEDTDHLYEGFTIFRNYNENDLVVEPIQEIFNFDEYVRDFSTTNLLSLDNYERYNNWPIFLRCMFGDRPESGLLAPFHYQNIIAISLAIAMGMLRNKSGQNCLVLQGMGSNGKSAFYTLLMDIMGTTCGSIKSFSYFNGDEINMQVENIEEKMFLIDTEAQYINLPQFKVEITDVVETARREIYKLNKKITIRAFFMLATNKGLCFLKDKKDPTKNDIFDYAFFRRVLFFILHNRLGEDTLFQKNKLNLHDISVKAGLKKGFMYWILDIIHVFGTPLINESPFIMSNVSRRKLASYNYDVMALIQKHYFSYGEITTSEEELKQKTKPIRFDEIFNKDSVLSKSQVSYSEVKESLEEMGFEVKTNHSNIDFK